jgi:hypothetical protein
MPERAKHAARQPAVPCRACRQPVASCCPDEAARFVSLDQLCLSPQCGFASTEEGNILSEDEQWAKLRLVVEVADEVWG